MLERPPRMATAMKLPAVFALANASVELVVVPASLLVCCTRAMFAATEAVLVREKLAEVPTPETAAVTVYGPPAVALAVKIAAVATPDALVVAVFTPPANVPLAPLAGAAKVTVTPLTGLLKESLTVACSCAANAVLTVALWGVPAVAAMLAAEPARLVNKKLA